MARGLWRSSVFWFYGLGAAAYGIKNNAFSYLLLTYCNKVLGMPGSRASMALAVAILWDAAIDLLFGHLSDKTTSRLGRRHPYMYASLVVLPPCFLAMFRPVVELDEGSRFAYVLLMSVAIRTGTTLFEVPCSALLPDLELDYHRRNRWLALRHAFGWYGGNTLHLVNFTFWVGAYGIESQEGYSIYGCVGAILIFVVILVSALGTQSVAASLPRPKDTFKVGEVAAELRQIFQSIRNPNFAALFFYGLLTGVTSGLDAALYLYTTTYYFMFKPQQIAGASLAISVSPAVAFYAAPFFGARWGKKRAAFAAIVSSMAVWPAPMILVLLGCWPALGSRQSFYAHTAFHVVTITLVMSIGVLLDSMMADVVEDSEVLTQRRSEGLFFAARGFAAKIVSAGGIVLAGQVVSLVGLDHIRGADMVTHQVRLRLAGFVVPLNWVLSVLSLFALSRYTIDHEKHMGNLAALAKFPNMFEEMPFTDPTLSIGSKEEELHADVVGKCT